MKIIKVFAGLLTVCGMLLLVLSCLAVMNIIQLDMDSQWGALAPFALGLIFFVGGLSLFKYLIKT